MPTLQTQRFTGRGSPGPFGAGYRSPGNRSFVFNVAVDMGNLPTLPDRMVKHFHEALIFHLADAAERVVRTAQGYLVRLEEPPKKGNIHGYDTGLMHDTLIARLATHLLAAGVFYDLLSDEAKYWRWVEFGHWFETDQGWQWWEGYHFLETAIEQESGYIRQRVREAWADTAIQLAAEASVPGGMGQLGIRPRGSI